MKKGIYEPLNLEKRKRIYSLELKVSDFFSLNKKTFQILFLKSKNF